MTANNVLQRNCIWQLFTAQPNVMGKAAAIPNSKCFVLHTHKCCTVNRKTWQFWKQHTLMQNFSLVQYLFPFFLLPLLPSAVRMSHHQSMLEMPHVAHCVQKWKNWNQYHPQASNHNQSLWRASCMCTLMCNKQLIHYTAIMYLSDGQHSYL